MEKQLLYLLDYNLGVDESELIEHLEDFWVLAPPPVPVRESHSVAAPASRRASTVNPVPAHVPMQVDTPPATPDARLQVRINPTLGSTYRAPGPKSAPAHLNPEYYPSGPGPSGPSTASSSLALPSSLRNQQSQATSAPMPRWPRSLSLADTAIRRIPPPAAVHTSTSVSSNAIASSSSTDYLSPATGPRSTSHSHAALTPPYTRDLRSLELDAPTPGLARRGSTDSQASLCSTAASSPIEYIVLPTPGSSADATTKQLNATVVNSGRKASYTTKPGHIYIASHHHHHSQEQDFPSPLEIVPSPTRDSFFKKFVNPLNRSNTTTSTNNNNNNNASSNGNANSLRSVHKMNTAGVRH